MIEKLFENNYYFLLFLWICLNSDIIYVQETNGGYYGIFTREDYKFIEFIFSSFGVFPSDFNFRRYFIL